MNQVWQVKVSADFLKQLYSTQLIIKQIAERICRYYSRNVHDLWCETNNRSHCRHLLNKLLSPPSSPTLTPNSPPWNKNAKDLPP